MFGRKKNKKQKNVYTGSYVVKDVDNIISIAQSYGIPWKDLAKVNDIDPPYILISGETISVPGEDGDTDEHEVPQISGITASEHLKKQTDIKNVRTQQSNNVITNDVKSNTSVAQAAKKPVQQKDEALRNKEKVQKITYASPKNMLHKPSAEPTTQSIDIEWMQDDEATYSEEIQLQRKKINTRFIIISVLIIVVVGVIVWRGTTWFLKQKSDKNVSVQTLIEKNENVKKDEVKKDVSNDKNKETNEELAMEGGEDLSQEKNNKEESSQKKEEEKQQNEKDVSAGETTVQVLNAGAQIGAASDVTKVFNKSGYKTSTARNAKNDYKGVVIYYSSDKKDNVDIIAKEVPQKYGTQKHEESDEVTKKYGADFVVVLGS